MVIFFATGTDARCWPRSLKSSLRAMLKYVQTPGDKRKREEDPNVQFYARKIQSRPQGAFVDVLHATWDGQWERLERLHGYIQWLFPVFENAGMNWESSPLTKEGARQIRESEVMSRRVLISYRLMLRFYGLRLVDERTGAALILDPRPRPSHGCCPGPPCRSHPHHS